MKKSNWIVLAVALLVSAFLLYLWYYLGFNYVDSPFDLVLSVIWWCVIVLSVVLIVRFEQRRREQIRTIYVSSNALFNSETGVVPFDEAEGMVPAMQRILDSLRYDFNREEMPEEEGFPVSYVVVSKDYSKSSGDGRSAEGPSHAPASSNEPKWEGTVVRIDREGGNIATAFGDRGELAALL